MRKAVDHHISSRRGKARFVVSCLAVDDEEEPDSTCRLEVEYDEEVEENEVRGPVLLEEGWLDSMRTVEVEHDEEVEENDVRGPVLLEEGWPEPRIVA
jgi:hypothetical protein